MAISAALSRARLLSCIQPQLVWFSEHKIGVFSVAAIMLFASCLLQWHSRYLPVPGRSGVDASCIRTRRQSLGLFNFCGDLFDEGFFLRLLHGGFFDSK